ncbi:MAG: arginine decarboxylase, partial [Christensenellales bacterium]|jgi:arginine decarboxylase
LDVARKQLVMNGKNMLSNALELARWARSEINHIDGLYAFGKEISASPGCYEFDETKLGVHVTSLGRSGYSMESLLRKEYNIQIELSDLYNILSIVTIGDRYQDLLALVNALRDISERSVVKEYRRISELPETPKMIVLPRDAFYSPKRVIMLECSEGEISGETIMAYPPGIPVICIGERITKDIIDYIKILKEERCELQGALDPGTDFIRVLGVD